MNLFLPEKTIYDSVRALDDRRLIKQILECKTILDVAIENKKWIHEQCKNIGYAKHPVVDYYKDYGDYIAMYGIKACQEYSSRFNKTHKLEYYFFQNGAMYLRPSMIPKPFYCEGSKTDPNCIRTTDNTVELFRAKLCKKWDNDKYPPKWTNRESPAWYQEHFNKKV